jgi:DNA polymerase-1
MDLLQRFAANPAIVKVAHNLAFEAMFLYSEGIVIQPPCYDTMAAAMLTLKKPKTFRLLADSGLKTLVPALFGVGLPSYDEVTGGRPFDELDPRDAETVRYACADSDYSLRLYHKTREWFDNYMPKHRFMAEQVESPTAIYCGLMKYNGCLVDTALMETKRAGVEAAIAEARERIAFTVGDVKIGENANTAAFKKYLYQDLGLPVFKTTAKMQEAMDDEALVLLREWCDEHRPELSGLFDAVQTFRRYGKIKSTYIDGYAGCINPATGRIHPDLFPLGTETGRFASRNPNLQNMPRAGTDDVGIRDFFIANPGNILLSLDFSQIELRVGAFYCRDEKMLDTYRTGGDIHGQTTAVIYGIPFDQAVDKHAEKYGERRVIAKNCNFGTFYGLFPRGLQKTLKFKAGLETSVTECEKIIFNLKAGYPALTEWQEETKQTAAMSRYTETWLGRRRYLPDITSTDWGKRSFAERCALNTPIQGTAAEILKLALARIVAGLPGRPWLRPLLQIHDELLFELPEGRRAEAAAFVRQCMEVQPFPEFDVPIVADASAGLRFGELQELEGNP